MLPADLRERVRRIKETVPVEAVVSRYADLRRQGRYLWARCPFPDHRDDTPSFVIRPDRGTWTCYGCLSGRGRRGDVIDFIQTYHGVPFVKALEILENGQFPSSPAPLPQPPPMPRLQKRHVAALTIAARVFNAALMWELPDSPPRRYLASRGISPEVVTRYRLGWATERIIGPLVQIARLPVTLLVECGILVPLGEEKFRLRFSGRIIIPEFRRGKALYMVGRAIVDTRLRYLNIPLPFPRIVFGLGLARPSAPLWVVEGPFCALSLATLGAQGVAILGSYPHEAELRRLAQFKDIRIIPQNDTEQPVSVEERLATCSSPASLEFLESLKGRQKWLTRGQLNALEWAEALHALGATGVRLVPLPAGVKDVNDLLVEDRQALERIVMV